MKTPTKIITGIAVFLLLTIAAKTQAQDKPYKDGTVWTMGYVRTMANMDETYLKSLASNWVKMHEEAKKQGVILSYKVLSGSAANPDDFNIVLMVEYASMAAMEAGEDKWDAISKAVLGDEAARQAINQSRVNVRTLYGSKMFREQIYQK